jgi:hypothetical protein
MAKESGLGMAVAVDDAAGSAQTISNDILSVSIGTPRGVQDITGIDKSAIERLLLLADGSITLNGVFNSAADESHDVFKSVSTTSVVRTVTITISGQVMAMEMFFSDYVVSRGTDGSLTWTAPAVLQNGSVPTWA